MQNQSGNVLFIILIAVALFAALSYALTRSRGGGNDIAKDKAMIAAAEIMDYATSIRSSVQMLQAKGCRDTQISFVNDGKTSRRADNAVFSYANPNAPADGSCNVFSDAGGKAVAVGANPAYVVKTAGMPADWFHPASWQATPIKAMGHGRDDAAGTDLALAVGRLKKNVCLAINEKLGIENPNGLPPMDKYMCSNNLPFTGSYPSCTDGVGDGAVLNGKSEYCTGWSDPCCVFDEGVQTDYIYFNVLISR